jgi:hypothetical protein
MTCGRLIRTLLQFVVLMTLIWSTGCGGGEDVGTPEQQEKVRLRKIEQAKRFQQEG